jgi:hypothetical protein
MAFQVTVMERVSTKKRSMDGVELAALTRAITIVLLAAWIGIHL